MTPKPLIARIVVAVSALATPIWAQTALFTDGGTFGGSKVFSEGMNPLGNPGRFSQAPEGYYFTYVDGDQRAQDNKSILGNTTSADPGTASAALGQLANAPWALRTRSYGFASIRNSGNLALTQEELNGMVAYPDLSPNHLGNGIGANGSVLDGRRAVVDRLSLGGGGAIEQGTDLGINFRVERWEMGQQTAVYSSPVSGQASFANADSALLGGNNTSSKTLAFGLDLGGNLEIAQGVRLGAMVDQLNHKRLGDVDMKPQFRGALQIDLGQVAKLTLESDLNSAERMPLPVPQQSELASLRIATGQATAFLLGVEQRKIDGQSVTRFGATLQIRTSSMLIAVGFQAGQDRPMKSATLMVN